ncbi:GNAT family N-acetyltransferase [Halobacillus sp. A5]|nr:GNAT family N-acetyltransferase [Halobacillus sp. A5]
MGDVYVSYKFRRKGCARDLTNKALEWFSRKEIQTVRPLAQRRC